MAPDLNAVAAGGKIDYSQPGSSGYNIPDITYRVRKQDHSDRTGEQTNGAGVTGPQRSQDPRPYHRRWRLRYLDGISDPEALPECRTRHLREERRHRRNMA